MSTPRFEAACHAFGLALVELHEAAMDASPDERGDENPDAWDRATFLLLQHVLAIALMQYHHHATRRLYALDVEEVLAGAWRLAKSEVARDLSEGKAS